MSKKLNPVGTTDELLYYRVTDTEKIEVERIKHGKFEKYEKAIEAGRKYVLLADIESLSFASNSIQPIAYFETNDEVMINNYFRDYWGFIIGFDAYKVLLVLIRECEFKFEKDYCIIEAKELAKELELSVNKVRKVLEILEEHNFIYRYYVVNKSRNYKQQGLLIKVRKFLKFLTNAQVNQLNSYYRKKHEEYMQETKDLLNPLFTR